MTDVPKPGVGPHIDKMSAPVTAPVGGSDHYPADAPDHDFQRWFLRKPFAQGNEVTTYLNAPDLWAAMRKEIEKTAGAGDFIYIIARNLGVHLVAGEAGSTDMEIGAPTPVKDHITLGRLLAAADTRNVQVRVIVSEVASTAPVVPFIHSLLKNNSAALYQHNHQKVLVVSNRDGLVAFCGGIDIHGDNSNWHDVHCRLKGPAAQQFYDLFAQRWQSHPAVLGLTHAQQKLLPPAQSRPWGDKHVQVVRTYPTWMAPGPERTIYELIANAIKTSKRFIYMEDQYLVAHTPMNFGGRPMSTLLADKLREPSFEALIILIARTEGANSLKEMGDPIQQGWYRRRKFIGELQQSNRAKVTVCTYKAPPNVKITFNDPVHVHSKTWIFDDAFAIFGSANCDRSGYTNLAEADVGVADENRDGNRPVFAHELRVRLWLKHLNGPGFSAFKKSDVADFPKAETFWRHPHPNSLIERYDADGDKKLQPPNLGAGDSPPSKNWESEWESAWKVADPDGS